MWITDLEPVRGHEQGNSATQQPRPCVIVSADGYNQGRSGLVVVVPLTTAERRIPLHIRIEPPEGGLTRVSFALSDGIRSVSVERLSRRIGRISERTLASIADAIRVALDL